MTPEPKLLAAGAAAFIAIVGGLVYGLYGGEGELPARRIELGWEGATEPAHKRCIETVGLASDEAMDLFRLQRDAGLTNYVYTVLVVDADAVADAGEEVALPPGMLAMESVQQEVPCNPDAGHRFMAVLQGEPEWSCACSLGEGCEYRRRTLAGYSWAPAPKDMTFQPEQFRGDGGCFPKTCVEFSGTSSMPEVCL